MNGKKMHDTAMMDAVPEADSAPQDEAPRPSVKAAGWAFGTALWLATFAAARAWLRVWWREPVAMAATLCAGMLVTGVVARCTNPVRAQSYADTDVAALVQATCDDQYPGQSRAQTIGGTWACVDSTTGEVLVWWYGDLASPGVTATPAPEVAPGTMAPREVGDAGDAGAAAASIPVAMSAAMSAPAVAPARSEAAANTTITALPAWLPDTVTRWAPEIAVAAERHGVAPTLVAIVTTVESCGLRTAVSPAGALGLMQVVPRYHPEILQGDPNDPAHNLDVGTAFLAELLASTGGDVTRAVCQYNGGGNCANLAESQRYMRWVGGMWSERDLATSPTFDAWMAAVRATPNNLCERAAAEARS